MEILLSQPKSIGLRPSSSPPRLGSMLIQIFPSFRRALGDRREVYGNSHFLVAQIVRQNTRQPPLHSHIPTPLLWSYIAWVRSAWRLASGAWPRSNCAMRWTYWRATESRKRMLPLIRRMYLRFVHSFEQNNKKKRPFSLSLFVLCSYLWMYFWATAKSRSRSSSSASPLANTGQLLTWFIMFVGWSGGCWSLVWLV